jgi:hypothetical protein
MNTTRDLDPLRFMTAKIYSQSEIDAALRQQEAERQAVLVRRDGFMCEAHPGLEFEHDPECAGPGTPWVIEGKDAVTEILRQREQEVRAEERERAARIIKEHREKDICRENCWTAITNEIRRDDTPQEGAQR